MGNEQWSFRSELATKRASDAVVPLTLEMRNQGDEGGVEGLEVVGFLYGTC